MPLPKPVSIVPGPVGTIAEDPQPLQVIGAIPGAAIAAATTTNYGTVKKATTQDDFAAADLATLITQLNAYLAKERTAGQLA